MVAHLVGGIGQHDDELVHARRYAAQQHGEPVSRKNGEDEPHRAAASLGADILRDLLHGGVIALRAGDHRFGNGEHIAVLNVKSGRGVSRRGEQTLHRDGGEIVSLPDDRCLDAS